MKMPFFRFLTGLEFRESSALISPKCNMEVSPNMIFVVYVGAQGLKNSSASDERAKVAAILLSDTVLITAVSFVIIFIVVLKARNWLD